MGSNEVMILADFEIDARSFRGLFDLLPHAPLAGLDYDEPARLESAGGLLQFPAKSPPVSRVFQFPVIDRDPLVFKGHPEVAHGGEEKCNPRFVRRNVLSFACYLGHPNSIFPAVETIEGR